MVKRNMRRWIAELAGGTRRFAIPILTTPGISLTGAAPNDVFRNGKLQFDAIRAVTAKFSAMAAALTMMDLSVEAEAFGAPILFSELENPTVSGASVHDRAEAEKLAIPAVGAARTGEMLLAARLCAEEISDRPTLGGLIGPFSLVGRLLDMSQMMLLTAIEPETVHLLLEKTTRFLVEYAKAFKATGCHGLIMAEPAAGLVSPKMSREFSANYIRRVVEAVQDESFIFILHNCGKTEKQVESLLSTGADALHVGNAVDVRKILDQTPKNVPVMGNLDPSGLFRMGTAESVHAATLKLLDEARDYPHFVLSSGCDIPPGTPMENIVAFFTALEEYNQPESSPC